MNKTVTTDAFFNQLLTFDDLKVWSVLVTIFGDIASQEDQFIAGTYISPIMAKLGIKPEAQRVALHRLRNDGWLEARKVGRVSHYSFSEFGRAETHAVHELVFEPQIARSRKATFVMLNGDDEKIPPAEWIKISDANFLSDQNIASSETIFATEVAIDSVPDWLWAKAVSQETNKKYEALLSLLKTYETLLDAIPEHDHMTVRTLILHWWRRIVLSHSGASAYLMPESWIGHKCRKLVHQWLTALPRKVG